MKVVALISGGKDSCFNMMHCVANGHEIVALANLFPKDRDELDSFMYQTVGHEVIEMYAKCMDLPLFRQPITGGSVDTSETYTITQTDEVEDLYNLLSKVNEAIPDIQAVSTGAILSNYQRVRVENVCNRLGLVSLAFLWQKDQSELLHSMIQFGLNAVLIKVAAIGLDQRHLGKSLLELHPHLENIKSKYGINVCGEGGEYETLTLSCPLFKKRILLVDTSIQVHSDDMFAPVAYLKVNKLDLVDNDDYNLNWIHQLRLQSIIPVVEFGDWIWEKNHVSTSSTAANGVSSRDMCKSTPAVTVTDSQYFYIISLTCQSGTFLYETATQTLNTIKSILESVQLSLKDAVLMTVYVKDMSQFSALNKVYQQYFGANPSPRVTVQLDMDQDIEIECIAYKQKEKHTLHVQSISYWAPANIGPYSQACRVGDLVFMAGMIGFDPSSMLLKQGSNERETFELQARQSIENCIQVAQCMNCDLIEDALVCVCYVTTHEFGHNAKRLIDSVIPKVVCILCIVPRLPRDALLEFQFVLSSKEGYHLMLRELDPHIELPDTTKKFIEESGMRLASCGYTAFSSVSIPSNSTDFCNDLEHVISSAKKDYSVQQLRVFCPSVIDRNVFQQQLYKKFQVAISIIPVRNEDVVQVLVFLRAKGKYIDAPAASKLM